MARKPKAAAKTSANPAPKKTAQKPLATGDVSQFPDHAFRADMGEGLPPQEPLPTATDRKK